MALVTAYSSKTGHKQSVPEGWLGKTFGQTTWSEKPPSKTTEKTPAAGDDKKGGK